MIPIPPGKRFQQALVYAAQLHASQMRKDSRTPYIAHLLATTGLVLEYGGSEDEAIAALLHDALEDQPNDGLTRSEIETQFGVTVLEIVTACSDTQSHPKPPWRARKEAFLATLVSVSPSACLVIAADKLHNTRTLAREFREHGDSIWARFKGGREGTLWFSRAVLSALEKRACLPPALLSELASAIAELDSLVEGEGKPV